MELREALSHIAEIRARVAVMERFRGYRAVPVGVSGVLAVVVALAQPFLVPDPGNHLPGYLALWLSTAVAGVAAAGSGIWWRWRQVDQPLSQQLTRLAVAQFMPCLAAGGLVTLVVARHAPEVGWMLPGLWQVLFSLGIFASCRLLPKPIGGVAIFYLLCGTLNLTVHSTHSGYSPWGMAVPFGLGQLATAGILYWHLERADDE